MVSLFHVVVIISFGVIALIEKHDKMTKRLAKCLALFILLFGFFQFARESLEHTIAATPKRGGDYLPDNYELYIYHSRHEMNLRNNPDFYEAASQNIEKGDIFYYANTSDYVEQVRKRWNFPQDNVTSYHFKSLKKVENVTAINYYVINSIWHYLKPKKAELLDVTPWNVQPYFHLRNSSLLAWIYDELFAEGWDASSNFETYNLKYIDAGLYGIRLRQSVNVYDVEGQYIKRLPRGAFVFASWRVPFATGRDNVQYIRIAAFEVNGSIQYGTFFIDGYDNNNRPTLNTTNEILEEYTCYYWTSFGASFSHASIGNSDAIRLSFMYYYSFNCKYGRLCNIITLLTSLRTSDY